MNRCQYWYWQGVEEENIIFKGKEWQSKEKNYDGSIKAEEDAKLELRFTLEQAMKTQRWVDI